MIFLPESSTWTKVEASGPGPSPRDKLAAAAIGDKIFCFGGFGPKMPEEEVMNELFFLVCLIWQVYPSDGLPCSAGTQPKNMNSSAR